MCHIESSNCNHLRSRRRKRQQNPILAVHVILWICWSSGWFFLCVKTNFLMQDRSENQFSLQCYNQWKELEIMKLESQTVNMRSSYQKFIKLTLVKAQPLVKKQPLNLLGTCGTERIRNYCVAFLVYTFRVGPSCLILIATPNLAEDVAS